MAGTTCGPTLLAVTRLLHRLREAMSLLAREVVKFGVVGAVAYVVDVGVFNALLLGVPSSSTGPLESHPLTAKAVSVAVATVVAWLGNRCWTFRRRRRASVPRELTLFVLMNGVGMLIALAALGISHYVLGFGSPLADNISANGVGLVLGTVFRFVAYRTWVFTEDPDAAPGGDTPTAGPGSAPGGSAATAASPRTGPPGPAAGPR